MGVVGVMHGLVRFPVLSFVMLLLCQVIFAGEFSRKVVRASLEPGVSLEIRAMIQDRHGFLWVGTGNGLYRLEGRNYSFFSNRPGDENSLIGNRVNALFEDRFGGIWVGTNRGLCRFDHDDQQFLRYSHDPEDDESIGGERVFAIAQGAAEDLWIGHNRGLTRLDLEDDDFDHFVNSGNPGDLLGGSVFSLLLDREDQLWIGTKGGLQRFIAEDRQFETVLPVDDIPPGSVSRISESEPGRFWVVMNGRLFIMDRSTGRLEPKPLPKLPGLDWADVYLFDVLEDRDGMLWLATKSIGLVLCHVKGGSLEILNHRPGVSGTLSYNQVLRVFQDRGGIVWAGTASGLNKIHANNREFRHYVHQLTDPNSLDDNLINAFLVDRNEDLWVATPSGLNFFEKKAGGFSRPLDNTKLADTGISSIKQVKDNFLWLATADALHELDLSSKSIETYPLPVKSDSRKDKESMFRMVKWGKFLLLGSESEDTGLLAFDLSKKQFRKFNHDPEDPGSLASNTILAIEVDRDGELWVATKAGLDLYVEGEKRFRHFTPNPEKKGLLATPWISSIYQDREGSMWFGTEKGLHKLVDVKQGRFEVFKSQQGLKTEAIFGLGGDSKGNLWFTHEKGLSKYNPYNQTAVHYDLLDGLNNKFRWSSYYQSRSGELFFGGFNGFNRFHPDDFRLNTTPPPVVLTSLYLKDQEDVPRAPLYSLKRLSIMEDRYVKFHFTALDFTAPRKNQYSYKMEGLSEEWSEPMTETWVPFQGLPEGKYRFVVRGSNSDGVWNEEGAAIELEVLAPFWKSNTALLLYVLLLPSMVYGFYRYRLRQVRARERKLACLVDERTESLRLEKEKTEAQAKKLIELDVLKTQFFSNVSHEFRTPLTLIIGPLEALVSHGFKVGAEKVKAQHEMMLRNARRLLRLINQLLDISKLEAGKMKLLARPGDLGGFVKPIVFVFQSLADKKDISLQVEVPEEPLRVYFDPEKIEKVLFNLLSNAFQFTPDGGVISVRVFEKNQAEGADVVVVQVSDTGRGIPARDLPFIFDRFRQADGSMTRAQEGTGIGLSLVKELVTLHRGDVTIESLEGEGTTVTVTLPLGVSHLDSAEVLEAVPDDQPVVLKSTASVEMAGLDQGKASLVAHSGLGEVLLIVDDHPDVRTFIRESFESLYRVVEAADGAEGLAAARNTKPHLIISDVMMPRMDGYEMCRRLKGDKDTAHIPIILLTAKASEDMKVEGLEIGADDYLSKPFNIRELQVRVRNLLQITGQERAMRKSLEMAHKAQVSMLPIEIPKTRGLDIATFSQPAKVVGGDYFDFVNCYDDKLGVVIGDVSGKGMSAALYMTMTKGLLQASTGKGISPQQTLARINRQFRRASASNIFISLIYAIIDPTSLKMTFSSAGHNPMILRHRGHTRILRSHGMAVGLQDGALFERLVKDEEVTFWPGDTLVLYTDGITEGMNHRNEVFGEQRLIDIVEKYDQLPAKDLMEVINHELGEFVGNADQFDDMTAMVIKIPQAA